MQHFSLPPSEWQHPNDVPKEIKQQAHRLDCIIVDAICEGYDEQIRTAGRQRHDLTHHDKAYIFRSLPKWERLLNDTYYANLSTSNIEKLAREAAWKIAGAV